MKKAALPSEPEDVAAMRKKISKIIEGLPEDSSDTKGRDPGDFWYDGPRKSHMVMFFNDILRLLDSELVKRMADIDSYNSPWALYKAFNDGPSPVRNYMILKAANLHDK